MEEVFAGNPTYECCKFRGSIAALAAATGKVLWKSYTVAEEPRPIRKSKVGVQLWGPSGAGVWSSPTADLKSRTLYVTTGDSYSDPAAPTSDSFLAFDLETGKLKWSQQMTKGDAYNVNCGAPAEMRANCPEANGPDFDFGSSAILVELGKGRRALIAGQKSGVVYALDPDQQGAVLWQRRVGRGGPAGGVQWGSAAAKRTCTWPCRTRSEEHTSELQSRLHLVCRLLLEKKKKISQTVSFNPRDSREDD